MNVRILVLHKDLLTLFFFVISKHALYLQLLTNKYELQLSHYCNTRYILDTCPKRFSIGESVLYCFGLFMLTFLNSHYASNHI